MSYLGVYLHNTAITHPIRELTDENDDAEQYKCDFEADLEETKRVYNEEYAQEKMKYDTALAAWKQQRLIKVLILLLNLILSVFIS